MPIDITIKNKNHTIQINGIKNKFTILKGDSGTGKTTLFNAAYSAQLTKLSSKGKINNISITTSQSQDDTNESLGIVEFIADIFPDTLSAIDAFNMTTQDFIDRYNKYEKCLVILDEGSYFFKLPMKSKGEILNNSKCCFLLISRRTTSFNYINYDPEDIFELNIEKSSKSDRLSVYSSTEKYKRKYSSGECYRATRKC